MGRFFSSFSSYEKGCLRRGLFLPSRERFTHKDLTAPKEVMYNGADIVKLSLQCNDMFG